MYSLPIFAAIGIFSLATFVMTGDGQALTLHTTDDTYINLNKPNQKNGTDKGIEIRNTGGGERQGFVRFDLGALPPDAQVSKANLRIWVDKLQTPGSLTVHEVLADWQEATLTAGTVPPLTSAFATVSIPDDKASFVLIDVTAVVQGWLENPSTNLGLGLVGDNANPLRVELNSKEDTATSHAMELEVGLVHTGPEGPRGIQGETGAQGIQGPQGIPGNLALAGQLCPFGEVLTGFDAQGNIVCASFFPPTLGGITGPFHDVAQGFINKFCSLVPDPTCPDQFVILDQLTRYEVFGQAQPGAAISIFLSPTCEVSTQWDDENGALGQFFTTNFGSIASLVLTPGFIDTVVGTSNTVPSNGTYTSTLLVVGIPPTLVSIQSSLGGSSCSNAQPVPQ